MRGLAHQAAAGVVLGDLRHRAAHVDVDDVGAHLLDDARGFGHLGGLAAEDLDRDGPLFLGVLGVLERAIDAAHQALAADHLGHDQTATALALHQAAKRRVGHARHRRDDKRRFEFESVPIFMSASAIQYGFTSAASTSTDTAWPIKSTDSTSRAWAPLRISRPTTPLSGP